MEVQPDVTKTFRVRCRTGGRDSKQEKVTLGDYPPYSLADAWTWRDDCKALAGRGLSPMTLKHADPIPGYATPAARELAQFFMSNWCVATVQKAQVKVNQANAANTVEAFALEWFQKMVEPANSNPRNIQRALEKEVIAAIGSKQLASVTVTDTLAITDKIKNRGSDQMALQTGNIVGRTSIVASLSKPAEVMQVIKDLVHEALEELADYAEADGGLKTDSKSHVND